MNSHVYVYCVTEGRPTTLPSAGMPEGSAPRAVPLLENFWLVASDVPSSTYNPESLERRLSDLDWVGHAGEAHHGVVDALAEAGVVVLPVRLFTLFSTEHKALETFREQRQPIARAFDRVRGREEWILRIGKPHQSRAESSAPAAAPPTSGAAFLKRKADARRETAVRAERVRQDATAAYEALVPLAESAMQKPIDPGGNLLIDGAFLIERSRVEAVRDILTRRAEGLLRDGCPVSLTGPWPPYSFASLRDGDDD